MSEENPPIPSGLYEQMDEEFDEDNPSYKLAMVIMEECRPGFVLIGSPNMGMSDHGLLYPDSIGIVVNDTCGITKTVLARILFEVATQLGEDMTKIERFIQEALNPDD